jgi:hypothetical protein
MIKTAVVYCMRNTGRAGHVARSMQQGFHRHGISSRFEASFRSVIGGDVAVAYGWAHHHVFEAYEAAGLSYVYWDLGYWNRTPGGGKGGRRDGHHRLAVNSWDTVDTMRRGMPSDRFAASGVQLADWRVGKPGDDIIVAGMSNKAAGTHGFKPGEWEAEHVAACEAHAAGNYRVVFRPKPDRKQPDPSVPPIGEALKRAALVVSHHSNVSVDALIAGVPSWCRKGVGKLWTYENLDAAVGLLAPAPSPAERAAFLSDVAYAQWTPAEMRSGEAWAHIREMLR